jgi:hypothetical protein
VKYCVREDDNVRRDPLELSRTGMAPSDIEEAVWKVLSEDPFGSTKGNAAQLRTSGGQVKITLMEVLGMKKFSVR